MKFSLFPRAGTCVSWLVRYGSGRDMNGKSINIESPCQLPTTCLPVVSQLPF
jgi:hypothetical protein